MGFLGSTSSRKELETQPEGQAHTSLQLSPALLMTQTESTSIKHDKLQVSSLGYKDSMYMERSKTDIDQKYLSMGKRSGKLLTRKLQFLICIHIVSLSLLLKILTYPLYYNL